VRCLVLPLVIPSVYKDRIGTGYRNLEATALAWSPDGTRLASGSPNGVVEIWDTTSGENVLNLMGHTSGIDNMEWSPDGTLPGNKFIDRTEHPVYGKPPLEDKYWFRW